MRTVFQWLAQAASELKPERGEEMIVGVILYGCATIGGFTYVMLFT